MKKTHSFKLTLAIISCLFSSILVAETHSLASSLSNPVPIATFADLQAAYTTSQSTVAGTITYLQFTADITTTAVYSFIPDAAHPVSIDANGKLFKVANSGTLGGSLTISSNTSKGIIRISGPTVTTITGGNYSIIANNAPIIYAESSSGIDNLLTKIILSNSVFTVDGYTIPTGPSAASIVRFFTSNGNLVSATNCTFNLSTQAIAFNCIGPQDVMIKDCTINFPGSDTTAQVFNLSPTNEGVVAASLTVDGLALTISGGNVFTTGGSQPINTIIRDIKINGIASATLTAPTGGTGVKKFYDFRAYTPAVSVPAGSYLNQQNVALTLSPTAILPKDATGSTIVYTTDGSEPLATSNTYTSPLPVATNLTIKMAALKSGFIGKSSAFDYAIGHTWTRTNPGGGGAFNCIKAGPTGIIVAGSDLSGAYMSKDQGGSFTCLGALQGISSTHVVSVGFDPDTPAKFYIGTTSSLHRTTDGGLSFTKVISTGDFSDIVVCESNPQYVYAARHSSYKTTDGAIYLSTDGGSTFSNVGSTGKRILKLIADPKNTSIIYYISGKARDSSTVCIARLYRSVNGGVTFSDITGGKGEVMDADIDPVTTSTIYMTTYTTFPGGNFYKSTNSGTTWSAPLARTGGIFVKRDEPNRVRVIEPRAPASWNAGSGTWESTNGGSSFTKTGDVAQGWETGYNKTICTTTDFYDVFKSYNGTGFEGIVRGFGTDMSDPNVIYWTNNQLIFRSSDGGVTFRNIFSNKVSTDQWQSRGADNVNMTDMAISRANPKTIYAGYFDIGFWRSLDGGQSWQSSNYLPYTGNWVGYGGNAMSIIADPSREKVVWTTMSGKQEGQTPTVLLKSTDSGSRNSWVLSNNGLPTIEVMGLSLDRLSTANNRTMYVTAQGYVYKSTNDGLDWIKLTNGLPANGGLRFTAIDNYYGSIVYAGGGSGLYASIDRGSNWTLVGNAEMNANGTLSFWGDGHGLGVFDIAPDPLTAGTVYVTVYGTGKGLYRGVKGSGASWAWTKLCTDDYMRKVCISPSNNNYIYATSSSAFTDGSYSTNSHGVYFSNDKFATSALVNNGMTWPFAMTVKCDSLNNVYVGSPGTGFQKAHIPGLQALDGFKIKSHYSIINPEVEIYPSISVSPTVVENSITVNRPAKRILVLNLAGKILVDKSNAIRLDMTAIKPGVYIVKVEMEDASSKTFKVVKL